MQTKIIERYFFFGLLLATFLFTFMIFRPFWVVLVLAVSFSIVLYPVFEWFKKRKLPDWLASFLTVFLFILVLCVPLLSIGAMVFNQSQDVYHFVLEGGNSSSYVDSINSAVNNLLPEGVAFNADEKISQFISFISDNIANVFTSTVSAVFSFLLVLLAMFFILKDGEKWKKGIVVLSPLSDKDDEKIISRLSIAVNGVIKGHLFIAIIQGILMGFGLWFFGIPNPALWGVLAAIASMLPTIGTALISVPSIIFLLATGSTGSAVGLMVWAVLVVGAIDNVLHPIIVGGKTNIPSLLILFSVLGGISLLGPIGILMGPLTVSMLYTLISIYRNEFKNSMISSTH